MVACKVREIIGTAVCHIVSRSMRNTVKGSQVYYTGLVVLGV